VATYGPNAQLFVPKWKWNPILSTVLSPQTDTGRGTNLDNYWLPINMLVTAELVAPQL
jgi:hypothetical protein